ncbi:MAG TPA: hypothetical protein PLP82_06960 [Deltaproteobacteria bacterium]|jgi:hypothetical protein|nr:hypothetical protein [Deltaproteobacteria bacterium]OQC21112.1 MAG: hypothetical protein BWX71_02508 [Deltaproteobacteria bacterium ADurb.Bin072]HRW79315.1 hypothetical protein [Desulfomonilia bacterium]NMD39400.1 hypothetical protein [Deltaproteobacteria bacterium]HNQ84817.1 hypothetical protein [Deltaproteobacteria bacterium]
MKKRLVVVKNGTHECTDQLANVLNANGWQCETIELTQGEPLPKSLQQIDGLLILGSSINVFEQAMNPMQVYVGS